MAIYGQDPTFFELLISYIYHYVILATVFSLCFVYFLFRTRAPLKEDDEPSEFERSDANELERKEKISNSTHATALVANGGVESKEGDQDLLNTILHGMSLADAVAAEDEAEEAHENQRVAGGKKATTDNEEEEEDGELLPRRRQIIREVTVRKIFLPPDARYADVENAAKRLIGADAQSGAGARKDSGTGGSEFRTAITNIRQASKRLEGDDDDDDLSPVENGSTM